MAEKFGLLVILALICSLIIFTSGCITPNKGSQPADNVTVPPANIIEGKGTVRYNGIGGGFYGIISDDGSEYFPVNIANEFKVDGQRVSFTAVLKENETSVYQWGTAIEIKNIQKITEIPKTSQTASPTSVQTSVIQGDKVSATGRIDYITIAGGFYGIIADDGMEFFPVNLPSAYKVKDTRVRFEGTLEKNVTSIYQWGQAVNITTITKL